MKWLTTTMGVLITMALAWRAGAQPVLRPGWPQDAMESPDQWGLQPNPLSIMTLADGTRIIATGTVSDIRIYDIDGNLLHAWSVIGTIEEWPGLDLIGGGPVLGDLDGDGEPEVVATLKDFNATLRAAAVYSLDGTLNSTLTQVASMSQTETTAPVLANLDEDPALELLFTSYSELHAIDQDGGEMAGFPWNVVNAHFYCGPVVVPGLVTGGDPVIHWVTSNRTSQNIHIHARAVGAEAEREGWPVTFLGDWGGTMPSPAVIPTEGGWEVAMVSRFGGYLWDQDGQPIENFPQALPMGPGASLPYMSVADLDGDQVPDLFFRTSSSSVVQAISLNGGYLAGFPFAVEVSGATNPACAALKLAPDQPALSFFGSSSSAGNEGYLFGYSGAEPLAGFPVQFAVSEWSPRLFIALFPPEADGTLPIVLHTGFGFTTVYNLPITPAPGATLEWTMPNSTAGGNRIYQPTPIEAVEGPAFSFTPVRVDFGEVEYGEQVEAQVAIQNVGTTAGSLQAAHFANQQGEGSLSLEANLPLNLAPGEITSWTLQWQADDLAPLLDTLVVLHDEDNHGTESRLPLTGRVLAETMLSIQSTVDFGVLTTDTPSATLELGVENDGFAPGVIDTILVPEPDAQVLFVDEDFPIVIAPGEGAGITLRWQPQQVSYLATVLRIEDNDIANQGVQFVQVNGVYLNGVGESALPRTSYLAPNSPNPFNGSTLLRFGLKERSRVTLRLFNLQGRLVRILLDDERSVGDHELAFDATGLASGVYLLEMVSDTFTARRKIVLLQ